MVVSTGKNYVHKKRVDFHENGLRNGSCGRFVSVRVLPTTPVSGAAPLGRRGARAQRFGSFILYVRLESCSCKRAANSLLFSPAFYSSTVIGCNKWSAEDGWKLVGQVGGVGEPRVIDAGVGWAGRRLRDLKEKR